MMMNRLYLPYLEFYITNVCNLTCQECNRFNNDKFKGWQRWSEYADIYERWSHELDFGYYGILGGEPTLNPTFYQWLEGLQKLWPGRFCQVGSNGTQLDKHPELYEILRKYKKTLAFNVACHNPASWNALKEKIHNFLGDNVKETFDDGMFKKCWLEDDQGVRIRLTQEWLFQKSALITNPKTGRKTLHNSNREKAHAICYSKNCHHFDKGQLYKCGPSSLFKEYDKQFTLELSAEDRQLIQDYKPLSIEDNQETKKKFIDALPNSISLCKFCPDYMKRFELDSIEKKDFKKWTYSA